MTDAARVSESSVRRALQPRCFAARQTIVARVEGFGKVLAGVAEWDGCGGGEGFNATRDGHDWNAAMQRVWHRLLSRVNVRFGG